MSQYGAKFDKIADTWAVIENEHDKHHPDRSQCGGVGGCSMMFAAVGLEHEMVEALEEWRRNDRENVTHYYFAGAYARRAELERYAGQLCRSGPGRFFVTSSWLSNQQAEGDDAGLSAGSLITADQIEKAWQYGRRDLAGLLRADAIVSFTGEGTRGGRHIEHGFALAYADQVIRSLPFRLIVVGPREHVFHCHPETEQYDSWDQFLAHETREEKTK